MNYLYRCISVAGVLVTVLSTNALEINPDGANQYPGIFDIFQVLENVDQKQKIFQLLESFTAGNDGFYNKVISPAKSPNINLSEAERTKQMNVRMADELSSVITAFDGADELKKGANALAAIKKINGNLNTEQSAHIEFIDGAPSAALSRTFLLLNKKNLDAAKALDIFSSYKRSAKLGEYIYEYADATNLTSGKVKFTQGSDQTWIKPNAAGALPMAQNVAIKKCRQIFGWKCVTSLYHANHQTVTQPALRYVFMASYDLNNNPDHTDFVNDRRSFNQVAGSTALYLVRESANWILLVGIDAQWNQDSLSFTTLIQQEFQKDFKRLIQRFDLDSQ